MSALLFSALCLGWVQAHSVSAARTSDIDTVSASGLISAPASNLASEDAGAAFPNALAPTHDFTITIQACQDGNNNGCEPAEPLVPPPAGVSACLQGPGLPPNNCKPITSPAGVIFTGLVTGAYTASLQLDPALVAMKYERTNPQTSTVTLTGCQCDVQCSPPACQAICHCNCEANIKLGIRRPPKLILTKFDNPDPVVAGSRLTYTIVARNDSSVEAGNVVIRDMLDPNVSFASASADCSHDGQLTDGVVTCNIGIIPASATISRTLEVTVSNPPSICTLTNTVAVSATDTLGAIFTTSTTITTGVQPGIIVNTCQDQDANGTCGPAGTSPFTPTGVLACLTNVSTNFGCKQVPAVFTSSLTPGVYTASLTLTGASQGYYPTVTFATTVLPPSACPAQSITLPLVDPIHPKGVAVHTATNKVYVAFQGPVVFLSNNPPYTPTWPYPFVAVIDGTTDQVLRTIPGGPGGIGREPWGVAASGNFVYVGSFGEGRVSVINPNSDTVIASLQPSGVFALTTAAVNPTNGSVHFTDYQGGRMVIISGMTIVSTPTVVFPATTPSTEAALSPFEIVVANSLQGYSFITLRDAFRSNPPQPFPPFKFASLNSISPFSLKPNPIILSNPAGASGTPHAIGLWQKPGMSDNPRFFITYADDPRPTNQSFPNPNKLLVYSFSISNPEIITKENEIDLGRDYAEVGLIFNQQVNHMLGTYAGFTYTVGIINGIPTNEITTCNKSNRGGTYALNFNGGVLGVPDGADSASVWKRPSVVIGNPPISATNLLYKNPFEIAINPNTGKVYVTDRCWNDWSDYGGANKPGHGAVLIFSDTPTSASSSTNGPIMLPIIIKDN
ncbi:MAG: DUF11 domain-containing protein [Chloroflexi bacterium]|nr:DUF11 domain-containing protein [Chloroflexota bacterium]